MDMAEMSAIFAEGGKREARKNESIEATIATAENVIEMNIRVKQLDSNVDNIKTDLSIVRSGLEEEREDRKKADEANDKYTKDVDRRAKTRDWIGIGLALVGVVIALFALFFQFLG